MGSRLLACARLATPGEVGYGLESAGGSRTTGKGGRRGGCPRQRVLPGGGRGDGGVASLGVGRPEWFSSLFLCPVHYRLLRALRTHRLCCVSRMTPPDQDRHWPHKPASWQTPYVRGEVLTARWVPGHRSVAGNEVAGLHARQAAEPRRSRRVDRGRADGEDVVSMGILKRRGTGGEQSSCGKRLQEETAAARTT